MFTIMEAGIKILKQAWWVAWVTPRVCPDHWKAKSGMTPNWACFRTYMKGRNGDVGDPTVV